ncbi:unnamed protein product [Diabrotica balteata]|uniref:HAT C-terminal dimerisation domain-containing protein n=1 Tax=Diabrotica balteata TaxID=107213 RepID=A0A9N9X7Z3_DIABA|nr:unnamed protein product [Diabrotica balteata]
MKNLLSRINKQVIVETVQEDIMEVEDMATNPKPVNFTLEQELEIELKRERENFYNQKKTGSQKDYEKILKKEMTVYETEGVKGDHLSMVYDYLMTLKPTSVETKRAFSATGCMCRSVRKLMNRDEQFNLTIDLELSAASVSSTADPTDCKYDPNNPKDVEELLKIYETLKDDDTLLHDDGNDFDRDDAESDEEDRFNYTF